jgi:WD40 repeat protein
MSTRRAEGRQRNDAGDPKHMHTLHNSVCWQALERPQDLSNYCIRNDVTSLALCDNVSVTNPPCGVHAIAPRPNVRGTASRLTLSSPSPSNCRDIDSEVFSAKFSPDGLLIGTGSNDGRVRVCNQQYVAMCVEANDLVCTYPLLCIALLMLHTHTAGVRRQSRHAKSCI